MSKTPKKVFVIISISVVFFISGFLFISGVWSQPEVQLFTHEFEHNNQFAQLDLRFESQTGVFTVGQEIEISAFLTLEEFNNAQDRFHLLYFPNSFTPDEYEKLLIKENFGKVVPSEDGSGFEFELAKSKILANLGVFPPKAELNAVWTQEGPKNALLIMDAEEVFFSEKQLTEQGMVIENVINIQPSDVKVQMKANNISIGLALVITGVTTLAGFFGVSKSIEHGNETKKKSK